MEYILKKELDYIFETNCHLTKLMQKDSNRVYRDEFNERHPGQNDRVYEYFNIPILLQEEIEKSVDLTTKEAKVLFNRDENFDICNYFAFGLDENSTEDEIKHAIISISENEAFSESSKDASLFEFITNLNFSIEKKYNLLEFFHNVKKYKDIYYSYYDKVVAIYKKYEALYLPTIDRFFKDFTALLEKEDFFKYLSRYVKFSINDSNNEVLIFPSFAMTPNSISFEVTPKNFSIFVGADFLGSSDIADTEREKNNKLSELFKILSDPTKLQILNILKEKTFYAAEIARELNLTTATISHHMNTLLTNKFIAIKKEGTRVFYEREEEKIKEYKDLINKSF